MLSAYDECLFDVGQWKQSNYFEETAHIGKMLWYIYIQTRTKSSEGYDRKMSFTLTSPIQYMCVDGYRCLDIDKYMFYLF